MQIRQKFGVHVCLGRWDIFFSVVIGHYPLLFYGHHNTFPMPFHYIFLCARFSNVFHHEIENQQFAVKETSLKIDTILPHLLK